MVAVANITEYSNSITLSAVLADRVAPAFTKSNIMLNHMFTDSVPQGTKSRTYPKSGTLTAAALPESTPMPIDAELTEDSVTATVSKCACVSGLSVEARDFGNITVDDIGQEQGSAIARFVDADALGLFSGLSVSVTATDVMTIDDLMLAAYNIYNANVPNAEVPLTAMLTQKSVYNIRKDIMASSASIWANTSFLAILQGPPQQTNGLVGSLPGINVYATTGFATSGGDAVQAVFHPQWTFGAMLASAPETWVAQKGSEGFYVEIATLFFYDVWEYHDLAGVKVLSDA